MHPAVAGGTSAETARWRDLNHNGRLDPYEDHRLPIDRRVDDLLARMTLEEKVGTMMHGNLPATDTLGHSVTGYDLAATEKLILGSDVTSFITRISVSPDVMARQNNAVQQIAARGRLGIPVTISTDPRNHFQAVFGASTQGGGFSLWPETLGLAAIGDTALVRRFGDIARREYRAVGIHMALSPQADLATEPRWPRVTATFGSDPALVSRMAGSYVEGFQGSPTGLRPDGVATVTKHWAGYGAEPEGFDAHNYYGRFAKLDQASFRRHVAAFEGALRARTAGIMPTYAILRGVSVGGKPLEPVAAGFSRQMLTTLLRGEMKFRGLIVSDWAITNDCPAACTAPTAAQPQERAAIGTPWGVETLSKQDRFVKGIAAGIDQFGGVADSNIVIAAVKAGRITPARIEQSARRVLRLKFELGLFDAPFVDEEAAARIVGDPATQSEGQRAQRRAQVLLENRDTALPVAARGRKVWLYKVDPAVARAHGFVVVARPQDAEVAILRVDAPSEKLHPFHFFGSRQNEGRLDFRDGDPDYEAIKKAARAVPTIVAINLDRPAILTNIRDKAAALIATFGASDDAVLDVVTGRARAEGHLPFALPSSMASVERQDPASSDDSAAPLYPFGYRFKDR
ncbi:glycoside hydrolase family 3 protein [Sphingomonas aracearum]|uniref:beta-glucosidase n=2 Tax=Sphingomonas aracearum TaxID=2283317 RepID=A0A369VV50_9SPHN|nr:glycoside hydrolase family 3 protein [Sphingomonas aracearum]